MLARTHAHNARTKHLAGLGIALWATLSLALVTPAAAEEEQVTEAQPPVFEATVAVGEGLETTDDCSTDLAEGADEAADDVPVPEGADATPAETDESTTQGTSEPALPDVPDSLEPLASDEVLPSPEDGAEAAAVVDMVDEAEVPAEGAVEQTEGESDLPAKAASESAGTMAAAPAKAAGEQTTDEPAAGASAPVKQGIVWEDGAFRYYQAGVLVTTPGAISDGDRLYIVADATGTLLTLKSSSATYGYRTLGSERYLLYKDAKKGVYYAKAGYAKKKGMQTYTRPDTGALVRNGAYVVSNKRGGRIIIADKDGRLASLAGKAKKGWVTSSKWGAKKKRYYLYRDTSGADKGMYYAKLGFSKNGYAHITTSKGYVRTKSLTTDDGRIYVINKKGKVAKPKGNKKRAWLTSDAFVKGTQRYHLTKDTAGLYKGAYYAVAGYNSKKSSGTYAHYTLPKGNVALSTTVEANGKLYFANAKGKLTSANKLMGIDIFSGDGDAGINISKLEAQFVIVKTTQGTSYLNPYWKKHADAVLKAGKLLGFYHYASTNCGGGSAKEQADYFVKTIGKKYIGKAVLCLDWEQNNGDNSNFGKGKTSVKWCKTFLDRVYKKTGVKPLIYMSRSVATGDNWKSVSDAGYGLWMAQYLYKYYNGSDTPHVSYQSNPTLRKGSYGSWSSPTIYQYTSEGKDKGYSGCLDFNTFYGSSKDWKKLAAQVK